METEVFSCPICLKAYDIKENIPRMVPSCGHTLCTFCLSSILSKSQNNFYCPFDKSSCQIADARNFPKNFALIQIMEQRSFLKSSHSAMGTCIIHGDDLRLICLEDKSLMCLECTFNGDHKSHEVITVDKFVDEVEKKIAKLEQHIQKIEEIHPDYPSQVEDLLNNQKEKLLEAVELKYSEYMQLFIEQKEKTKVQIIENFENLFKSVKPLALQIKDDELRHGLMDIIKATKTKIDDWINKKNYQDGYELYSQDIDDTIAGIEQFSQRDLLSELKQTLSNCAVSFNSNLSFAIKNCCTLRVPVKINFEALGQILDYQNLGLGINPIGNNSKFVPPPRKISYIPNNNLNNIHRPLNSGAYLVQNGPNCTLLNNQPQALNPSDTQDSLLTNPSAIPEKYLNIYNTVKNIFEEIQEQNPRRKMELFTKINLLLSRLVKGQLSMRTIKRLEDVCQNLEMNNLDTAKSIFEEMIKEEWEQNKDWLLAFKRIVMKK